MPQVPTYQRPQVELGPGMRVRNAAPALPKIDVATQQTNALARGVNDLADSLDRTALQEANREAFATEAELKKSWLDYSAELEKNRQGMGAKGVTAEVEKWWADTVPKFTEKTQNGVSQRMVQQSAQRLQLAAMGQFRDFESRQLEVAGTAAFTANVNASIESAAANPTPENIALHRTAAEAAIRQRAVEKGWAPEVLNAELADARSGVVAGAFNGLLRRDPNAAAQFLDANSKDLDERTRNRLTDVLKPIMIEKKGEEFANSVVSLPIEQQIEKAQAIADPEVRKAAIGQVKANDDLREIARRRAESQASDAIWQMVGKGAAERALPPDVLARMDGRERVAVKQHYEAARKAARAEAEGKAVKTDMAAYERLVNMPPEDFLGVRLSTMQDKISRGDLEKLIDRQAKLRNPKEAGDVASTEQQMNTYASILDLKGEKKGAFQQASYNEFEQFRQANKREPNYKERQEILDRLTMQHDGGWFGSSKRLYEVPATPAERAKFVNQAVPETERKAIIDALTKRGLPVTNELILDAYRRANPK